MDIFSYAYTLPFLQMILAMLLGTLLGVERTFAQKTAGMRTYGLVCMGSCLFILISTMVAETFVSVSSFDPLRLAAGVVTGIGFLGAGLIIMKDSKLSGLTTAAGLWVSCGIGMAVGFKFFSVAIFATILTLFSFTILWSIELRVKAFAKKDDVDLSKTPSLLSAPSTTDTSSINV